MAKEDQLCSASVEEALPPLNILHISPLPFALAHSPLALRSTVSPADAAVFLHFLSAQGPHWRVLLQGRGTFTAHQIGSQLDLSWHDRVTGEKHMNLIRVKWPRRRQDPWSFVLGWTKRGNCRKSVSGRSVCAEFSPLKIVSLAMQRACLYEEVHLFFWRNESAVCWMP